MKHQSNKHHKPLRIWLVGGSEGIGLALTSQLLSQGHTVLVSSRNSQKSSELNQLESIYPTNLKRLDLDVTDDHLITEKVNHAWDLLNGIDVWFYNAGAYHPMSMDEWDLSSFTHMNQVNYLGCVKLMIALKAYFLKQGFGRWIWNISLAADFGLPYGGGYSAPKAGLLNLAESLQPELKTQHIELQVINHGFVKTRLTAKNDFDMLGIMSAEQAGQKIAKLFERSDFETRFPFSLATLLWTLKRLPKSLSLILTKRMLKK